VRFSPASWQENACAAALCIRKAERRETFGVDFNGMTHRRDCALPLLFIRGRNSIRGGHVKSAAMQLTGDGHILAESNSDDAGE